MSCCALVRNLCAYQVGLHASEGPRSVGPHALPCHEDPGPAQTSTVTRVPRATCHVQVADALFRMDAPPWIRAHAEGLTGSASLDLEPAAAAAAAAACAADPGCCSLASIAAATAAAGGADARALRRAHLQVGSIGVRVQVAPAVATGHTCFAHVPSVIDLNRAYMYLSLAHMLSAAAVKGRLLHAV